MFIGTVAIPALCRGTVSVSYQDGSVPSSYHIAQRLRKVMTSIYKPADSLGLR